MSTRAGRWLMETRSGRTLFLAVTLLGVLGAAYMVIRSEVGRQTSSITKRVEVIERVSPFDVVRACLRNRSCRALLVHPERPLPAPRARGGGAPQYGSTGSQRSGPRGGDEQVGAGGGAGAEPGDGRSSHPSAPGKGGGEASPAPAPGGTPGEQNRPAPAAAPPPPPKGPPVPAPVLEPSPIAESAGKALEGVGETVRETGETANGAVEGVTGKACELLGADC